MAELKTEEVKVRRIVVSTVDAELVVTVAADAKITFGPSVPGPTGSRADRPGWQPRPMEYALRIYGAGGKDDLRAVFTGVRDFRDEDIGVAIKSAGAAERRVMQPGEDLYFPTPMNSLTIAR